MSEGSTKLGQPSTCTCTGAYTGEYPNCVLGGGASGDPQLTAFTGERFQVHGLPGAVYQLFESRCLRLRALFGFLQLQPAGAAQIHQRDVQARGMSADAVLKTIDAAAAAGHVTLSEADAISARLRDVNVTLSYGVLTQPLSHAGNYLVSAAILLPGVSVRLEPGAWAHGFHRVSLQYEDSNSNSGKIATTLQVGDVVPLPGAAAAAARRGGRGLGGALAYSVSRINSHQVLVHVSCARLVLTSSHHFMNVDSFELAPNAAAEERWLIAADGLLGRTYAFTKAAQPPAHKRYTENIDAYQLSADELMSADDSTRTPVDDCF
jgi:hypothetical protein